MNDLEVLEPRSAADVSKQIALIQTVMKDNMQGPSEEHPDGVHYGVIPGTKKPTLLKPGAEKLSLLFRLRPIMESGKDVVTTDLGNGHREITVYCHILNANGTELATGIGSCSTMENKYRYRGGVKTPTGEAVPKEFWNLKKDGKFAEAQELIGGRGYGTMKTDAGWMICELGEKAENPDIADTYNTVLKMAKKRSYVDGILSATAASDIFTQDEDADIPATDAPPAEPKKPPVKMPEAKPAAATPPADMPGDGQEPAPGEEAVPNAVSVAQVGRFYAKCKASGKSDATVSAYLMEIHGLTSAKHITKAIYDICCAWGDKKG